MIGVQPGPPVLQHIRCFRVAMVLTPQNHQHIEMFDVSHFERLGSQEVFIASRLLENEKKCHVKL